MCVIAIKPAGVEIPLEDIRQCWNANPDGAGLMFITDSGVRIGKGFATAEQLEAMLKGFKDLDVVIHYRLRTHGKIDEDNCHPFPIGNVQQRGHRWYDADCGFVHNGIISGWGDEVRSDSRQLAEDVLSKLGDPEAMYKVLQSIGGYSNKFVLLSKDTIYKVGDFVKGAHGGVTYSNMYWRSYFNYRPVSRFSQQELDFISGGEKDE